jgi:nucleotidyltransferase substrate binding protein (TIGR01987 family)
MMRVIEWPETTMTETLDLTSLRQTLASLQDAQALVHDAAWFGPQPPRVKNTVVAGLIQNFEFVYELGVKMIRRQLELEAASPTEVDESSFRDMMRLAGERGLVGDVEAWFGYRRLRNITAHTYDQAKARLVLDGMAPFVSDAQALLRTLESRHA